MKEFEVKVWEKISLWRRVTVKVKANSKEEVEKAINNNTLESIVTEWVESEDNLDTIEHISYDPIIDLEIKDLTPIGIFYIPVIINNKVLDYIIIEAASQDEANKKANTIIKQCLQNYKRR